MPLYTIFVVLILKINCEIIPILKLHDLWNGIQKGFTVHDQHKNNKGTYTHYQWKLQNEIKNTIQLRTKKL